MKTRLFSGWKTRAQMLCLAALCGLMTAGVASTAFAAQDTVAPTTEAPATDAAPAPVEAAAPAEAVAAPAEAPAEEAPAEEALAPTISKPDTVWVLVSAVLVIFMTLPGLALFYGGLVRSKNVLSILIQNLAVFSLVAVLWALYGYSFAFTEGNAFIGGVDRKGAHGQHADVLGALRVGQHQAAEGVAAQLEDGGGGAHGRCSLRLASTSASRSMCGCAGTGAGGASVASVGPSISSMRSRSAFSCRACASYRRQ